MEVLPHSKPTPPKALNVLNALLPRINASEEDRLHFDNLQKGFVGEVHFYRFLKQSVSVPSILLNNLLFKVNRTEFEIDSLLICRNTIYMFEVKNYEGDFLIQDDRWFVEGTEKEIRNPLFQLKRSDFLLRQLLLQLNFDLQVKSYLVFMNHDFTLYQLSPGLPILLRSQLHRFIKKINKMSPPLTEHHFHLREQLYNKVLHKTIHEQIPAYDYSNVKKGILCSACQHPISTVMKKKIICKQCNREEGVREAIFRSVKEFHLLFPDEKITTSHIYEWCNATVSKKLIRNVLLQKLQFISRGRYSYYVFRGNNA
jgi:hypothetical protein